MEKLCEELCLCENGWKAEQIAVDYYSSWRIARDKKGLFNVATKVRDKIKKEEGTSTINKRKAVELESEMLEEDPPMPAENSMKERPKPKRSLQAKVFSFYQRN
jgi:hypothetical protein